MDNDSWPHMEVLKEKLAHRERLDKVARESKHWPNIPRISRYCKPVLFKPRKGTMDHRPYLEKSQWVILFTDIDVMKAYRGHGLDRHMVRTALEQTRLQAQKARRPLLAAVQPGCVQLMRFHARDPKRFKAKYGSMRERWPELQRIEARQERFWLDMGFQRFRKNPYKLDLSNFFFWSGASDLPEPMRLGPYYLEAPEGSEAPDASMDSPEPRAWQHWCKSPLNPALHGDDSVPTP